MSESLPSAADLESSIHDLAQAVRSAHHLTPEAQRTLADLVDELSKSLHTAPLSTEEAARLAVSTANVVHALKPSHEPTLLAAARDRLETAVARAQTAAPVATGLARRFLDMLADLGI